MSLTEQLNEKYSIRPFLIFPQIRRKLNFVYENSIGDRLKQLFEDGLHDLSLDISTDRSILEEETILVSSTKSEFVFKLNSGKIYRFEEKEPINAMLWTAYSLAADNGWLPDLNDCNVLTRCYNISSQRVASNILYSVKRKFDDIPDVFGLIKGTVLEFSDRFVREIPLFTSQIVTGNGIELIQKQSGLFALKKEMRLENLAETLYGESKNFSEEISEYCEYLSSSSDNYRKAMTKAVEKCINRFYSSPIYRLNESVENVRIKMSAEYDFTNELSTAKEKLGSSRKIKNITPDIIKSTFADIESDYRNAAQKMVITHFLTDLTEELQKRINGEFRHIIDNLKLCAVEMENYSVLNEADYGINISWNKDGEADIKELVLENASWKSSDIQNAQIHTRIPSGYTNSVWFAGEEVFNEAKANGSQYPVEMLKSLDKSLLCALCYRDNTRMERMI